MCLRKRLFSLFCCFLIGICLIFSTSTAYAASDLNLSESEMYCLENGYLAFDPADKRSRFGLVTADEFINAIMLAFFPESDLKNIPAAEWLYDQDVITGPELARLRDDRAVNWIMVWRITEILSGNWPVPAQYFPEIKSQARCEGVYADARATAIKLNLATGHENAIARFTRSEFAVYFHRLMIGDYTPVDHVGSDLPGFDLIDFERSILTPGNYRAWNGYFKGFANLPEKYLNAFRESGWSVIFNPVYIDQRSNYTKDVQGGLCSYDLKEIYLNKSDERGLYHEFGHYIMAAAGVRSKLPAIFNQEAENMREILGDYSQTSPDEYFADCVKLWIHSPEQITILKEKSPRMYGLINSLIGPEIPDAA